MHGCTTHATCPAHAHTQVSVVTVEHGTAVVRYKGPPAIGKGVIAAIRDKFPDIKEVLLV